MYNSIIFFNKKDDSWKQFLLSTQEFESIKNYFSWRIGPEDFVIPSEDYFNRSQLQTFKDSFKTICEDFKYENYYISFSSSIYFKSVESYIKNRFYPIKKGACRPVYDQIEPKNGRPTFKSSGSILEWHHEYGLYREYRIGRESKSWFKHPVTHRMMFYNENEYENFIQKSKIEKKKLKKMKSNGDLFIRVINVYDKQTKQLKYRIINEEFVTSGLELALDPFEGDDILFLRSYKIDNKIAQYIEEMYDQKIDFDFNKNEYYIESLSAENFQYSYKELINRLKIQEG